jgi:CubicO group peptidase (beta-lactamase class C family)
MTAPLLSEPGTKFNYGVP